MYFPSLTSVKYSYFSPGFASAAASSLRFRFRVLHFNAKVSPTTFFSAPLHCFCLSMKREIVSVSIFDIEVYVSGSFRGRALLSGEVLFREKDDYHEHIYETDWQAFFLPIQKGM